MSEISAKIRSSLQFCYYRSTNATPVHKRNAVIYGRSALLGETTETWFSPFYTRNLNVKNTTRSC